MVNRALVVAVGVNAEGRREVLGTACGPAETEAFWLGFLRTLACRGLSGVRLVVSDAHEGLKSAIAKVLQATWQRCRVHFMRNALGHVPRRQHQMVAAALIDRLLHHYRIVNIRGNSYRMRAHQNLWRSKERSQGPEDSPGTAP